MPLRLPDSGFFISCRTKINEYEKGGPRWLLYLNLICSLKRCNPVVTPFSPCYAGRGAAGRLLPFPPGSVRGECPRRCNRCPQAALTCRRGIWAHTPRFYPQTLDQLRGQRFQLRNLFDFLNEPLQALGLIRFGFQIRLHLRHSSFQRFLLLLIGQGQGGVSLIGQLAAGVVLIDFLNQSVNFCDKTD